MNPTASRIAVLMGTASLVTIANAISAQAQNQQVAQAQTAQAEEIPETVLITGSLIRGTAAVGVPVTNLGLKDFQTTGAIKTADLFRTVPAANVYPTGDGTNSGGHLEREQRINLRGLDATGPRALMMIDGMRFPPQADGICSIDPSIIPALSLDHVDVLADGASATYGSDAISGVINLILKRNFDGAITQLGWTTSDGGKNHFLASALWGRTWDGGQVTLSYEWYDDAPLSGSVHSKYTLDFSPWGLDNRVPLGSSAPGTISTGAPAQPAFGHTTTAASIGLDCTNCYAVPHGTGGNFNPINGGLGPLAPFSGSTLNWSTFNTPANSGVNGTRNEFDVMKIALEDSGQQRNAAVITVDQRLTKDISFYGEGFYSNRRGSTYSPANATPTATDAISAFGVPTFNPYYPTGGAPTNLRINYSLALEVPTYSAFYELATRYQMGLHVALPAGWNADIFYAQSGDANVLNVTGAVNKAAVSAALGWTIATSPPIGTAPAIATWTKPASVPYLNLFCDATQFKCNSDTTLQYIKGLRRFDEKMAVNEKGIKFDGPLFDLPAGTVKAAIGGVYDSYAWTFTTLDNTGASSLIMPYIHADFPYQVWGAFAQLNVPILGDNLNIPGFRKVDFEASWRHDQYTGGLTGGTSNPKFGVNWLISEAAGLTFRGSWGTSFRFANAGEASIVASTAIQAYNLPASLANTGTDIVLSCVGPTPPAGSVAAKEAAAGFACGSNPGGLSEAGAPHKELRPEGYYGGGLLKPESSTNWAAGLEFAPQRFLPGLDLQATWYQIKINGVLLAFNNPTSNSFNDSTQGFHYIVPSDLAGLSNGAGCAGANLTPTNCAPFQQMVTAILLNPRNSAASPLTQTLVYWINDGGTVNKGWRKLDGVDWTASYDWDMGALGAFNVGMVGTYYLHNLAQTAAGAPITDAFHTTLAAAGGLPQNGVESLPRMHYRARLGWSNGPWSVTGFVNYDSHFFHTQSAPPNVNAQCVATGSALPGGTFPCLINGYSNIEPSQYLFDLSLGYDTGDAPVNAYLKNIGVNFVIRNITGRHPAFEYGPSATGRGFAAYDILKSDDGRTFNLILTKTW
jgi:iron complex outermembrane receptor protein